MNFFKRKRNTKEALLEYMRDVLGQASIQLDELALYVIGQYNHEDKYQIQNILDRLSDGDCEYCRGYHDSQLTSDLVIIYLAVTRDTCKILIVYDPVELFDNPSLLGTVDVKDCDLALQSTVNRVL